MAQSGGNHNGNRGWFEGTMEVISGMAPRPSTPQPYQQARSMSAPNSPARPFNFPGINRLPSQDSLDRSIHNESGHGKSTAQIIRDLKSANASLSAKSASMEAQFMNQLASVTKKMEEKQRHSDEQLRQYKKQLAHMEAYKAAVDAKMKEKDSQLSKVKEESAFQRHTISDLKNQLFQLQSEMEDQEMEKRDEYDQLLQDNQEMARQLAMLTQRCNEYENALASKEQDQYYRRQLQESQGELETQRKRLTDTQVNLQEVQQEKETLEEEHALRVQKLEFELEDQAEQWRARERDLLKQIESMEFTDSQLSQDLRMQLEERDETILELQMKMDQYADKAAELAASLAQAREDAENQEQYRRDEAEDLRILHDAQEVEITKLRKELDDVRTELELRDDELVEKDRELKRASGGPSKHEIENLRKELAEASSDQELIAELEHQLAEYQERLASKEREVEEFKELQNQKEESREDPGVIREMEEKLNEAREKATRLEQELVDLRNEHATQIGELQSNVNALRKEKEAVTRELAQLRKEKDTAVSNLNETNSEFSKLKNHWEQKSGAEKEVERLRKELEITKEHLQESVDVEKAALETMKERLQESAAIEKAAQERVQELENKLKEMESLKQSQESNLKEIERLQAELEEAQSGEQTSYALEDAHKEIDELHKVLESWENGENSNKLKKQLRDAQIALVALDDEKKIMAQKHRELLSAVEKKKEDIQRDAAEQLESKEREIHQLQSKVQHLEEAEASREKLTKDLSQSRSRSLSLESELSKSKRKVSTLESELVQVRKKLSNLEPELEKMKNLNGDLNSDLVKMKSEASSIRSARSLPTVDSVEKETEKDFLKSTIEKLTEEKETLRVKLKDRDTTIAALVRSSMKLEQKIAAMETELSSARSVQSIEQEKTEEELTNLRNAVSALKQKEPQLNEDIATLKRELKLAKSDAKRFRKALQEDGTTGSEYRFQIALLQKELEETAVKVEERDIAIENLVNQSISQDAHVKDLKTRISNMMKEGEKKNKYDDQNLRAEIRRLQQESEIFAGQIIEQDDELEKLKEDLKARDDQVATLRKQVSQLQSRGTITAPRSLGLEDDSTFKKEISKLQSDLRARESQIEQLKEQLESYAKGSGSGPSGGNSQRVAELQAELDELREAGLENRSELRDLRRQLWDAKEAAGEANDLKIELAQAKYALEELKRTGADTKKEPVDFSEINKLKRELEEALASKQSLEKLMAQQSETFRQQKNDSKKLEQLQRDLEEAFESKKALEKRMAQQSENIRRQKNEAIDRLQAQIKQQEDCISELRKNSSTLNEDHVTIFQQEIEALRKELGTKTELSEKLKGELSDREAALQKSEQLKLKLVGELSATKTAFSKFENETAELLKNTTKSNEKIALAGENEALKAQNDALTRAHEELSTAHQELSKKHEAVLIEIDSLRTKLEELTKENEGAESLRSQLEQASQERESSEKNLVEVYERQLSTLSKEKDTELDNLRRDLAASRGKSDENLSELVIRIRDLEKENDGLREQFEIELQAKNQQIYALEHTLHAQEQTVESMREEMDQLQSGMEHATERRRGEVEDLQQEIMQIESRAMRQEREIIALRMQLEESKLEHKAEVVRLKDVIVNMEKESPLARTVAELQNDDRMLEVRERLEQLKMRNTDLQEENLKLGGRLERAIIEIRSFEAEKRHAEEMEHENASLRRQVQGLEQILSQGQRPPPSAAAPARTPVDKENNIKAKEKAPSKQSKKSFKGLFKRRSHGLQPDEIIKEEKEEDLSVTN